MESVTGNSSFVSYKGCTHAATEPVLIGGHPIYLAASPALTSERLREAQVLLPLNAQIPSRFFGQAQLIFCCGMQDHGGVPSNWKEFILDVAQNYMPKHYNMVAWCHGSHGRTGCFAASLVAVMMPEIADPIAWIREHHCAHAVESKAQAAAVFALRDQELPQIYQDEFAPKAFISGGGSGANSRAWYPGRTYTHDIEWNGQAACTCSTCSDLFKKNQGGTRQGYLTPCLCAKWSCCADDREGYEKRNQGAALLPEGVFLAGSMDDPRWHYKGPWFWSKRFMHCRDCSCDEFCKRRSGNAVIHGIIWRMSPCNCSWSACKDARAQWADVLTANTFGSPEGLMAYLTGNWKEGEAQPVATAAATPLKPAPRLEGKPARNCIASGDCLCPAHIITATHEQQHRNAIDCTCRDCAIMEKLFSRGDLEYCHRQSKHHEDCMCKEMCWLLSSDTCPVGCLCYNCLWLNTEAEELAHLITQGEDALDATNSGQEVQTKSSGAS